MRLGRCLVATEDVFGEKAVTHAHRLQRHQCQFVGIAGQHAEAAAALAQRMQQLAGAFGRACGIGQLALVLQQPGTLGRRFVGRQRGQVMEDVVLLGNLQGAADRGEIVHGDGQGAVHVEHPVPYLGDRHIQSSRTRIRPSCATEATSSPWRLKMLPRAKPRALPAQGLSME